MATPEERETSIEDANVQLVKLSEISASSLARTDDLSRDINFSKSVPYFEQMLDVVKQLKERDISRLSITEITKIKKACTQISALIEKVNNFTLNQNTPADICKAIVEEIKAAYDGVMDLATIPLAFTATQATDYARIEREAKGYHSVMKEEAAKFQKFLEQSKVDAEKALNAVREQAAEAGVATNAQIFLSDSGKHGKDAGKWLAATIGATFATILTAAGFVLASFYYHPQDIPSAIQYTVSKIILLSTLSFVIFWCARNYRALKHNETLNKHRANALMTFRAFVEGTNDQAVKDTILMHAAQAAFTGRPTGFDSQEKESQNVNPVVEILGRTISKENVASQ